MTQPILPPAPDGIPKDKELEAMTEVLMALLDDLEEEEGDEVSQAQPPTSPATQSPITED